MWISVAELLHGPAPRLQMVTRRSKSLVLCLFGNIKKLLVLRRLKKRLANLVPRRDQQGAFCQWSGDPNSSNNIGWITSACRKSLIFFGEDAGNRRISHRPGCQILVRPFHMRPTSYKPSVLAAFWVCHVEKTSCNYCLSCKVPRSGSSWRCCCGTLAPKGFRRVTPTSDCKTANTSHCSSHV